MALTDVTFALEAKSDQLNAVDLMASHRTIKIREVKVKKGEQPVSVFFDGDNNKPWKPCKGMLRILATAWGKDSADWIGKHAEIYLDQDVVWAGKAVGGIRIKSLSDIDPKGIKVSLAINRQTRIQCHIDLLTVCAEQYPDDKFNSSFDIMVQKMSSGEMTLQVVIAHCHKTGTLSPEQIKRLEEAAPKDPEDDFVGGGQDDGFSPEDDNPFPGDMP